MFVNLCFKKGNQCWDRSVFLKMFLLLLYLLCIHLLPWCQLICAGSCTDSFGFSDLYSCPGHVACLCIWRFWGESPPAAQGGKTLPPAFFQARRISWLGNEGEMQTSWNTEPEFCISRMLSGHVLVDSNHVASSETNTVLVHSAVAIGSLVAWPTRLFPSPLFWMYLVLLVYCMFFPKCPTA